MNHYFADVMAAIVLKSKPHLRQLLRCVEQYAKQRSGLNDWDSSNDVEAARRAVLIVCCGQLWL